ncbi:hypothetical protein, partial [Alloalcanivorax gelatiniphagus]
KLRQTTTGNSIVRPPSQPDLNQTASAKYGAVHYTTKHKKKAPTAKVSPFYKKTIGYGLPDFAEELNYGVDLSTI